MAGADHQGQTGCMGAGGEETAEQPTDGAAEGPEVDTPAEQETHEDDPGMAGDGTGQPEGQGPGDPRVATPLHAAEVEAGVEQNEPQGPDGDLERASAMVEAAEVPNDPTEAPANHPMPGPIDSAPELEDPNSPAAQADDAVMSNPPDASNIDPAGEEWDEVRDEAPIQRRRKTEAERKASKPEFSCDAPEDEWMTDIELANVAKLTSTYARHAAAPYAFTYRGVLRGKFRDRIMELRDRQGQSYLSVDELKRVIDNYPAYSLHSRFPSVYTPRGEVRRRAPKANKDLHDELGHYVSPVTRPGERVLSDMKRHELVYSAVKDTPITADNAGAGVKRIKKERKELDEAQVRIAKREHDLDELEQELRKKFVKKNSKATHTLQEEVRRLQEANKKVKEENDKLREERDDLTEKHAEAVKAKETLMNLVGVLGGFEWEVEMEE